MLNFPEVGAWYTQLQIDKQRQAASGSPLISANSQQQKMRSLEQEIYPR